MHVIVIAAIAAFGGLLFGYDTGVISGALLFLRKAFHLSSLMQGVVTSIALLATAGIGVVNVVMTLVAIWLVDRAGRRALLLTGLIGMGVSLCLLAVAFLLGTGSALGWFTAASLAAYVGFFAIGLGPVFWLLISEIFPLAIPRARHVGSHYRELARQPSGGADVPRPR